MRSWGAVIAVLTAGCVQQETPGKLLQPGPLVVVAPENLQRAPPLDPLYAVEQTAPIVFVDPPPPLQATSALTPMPAAETRIGKVRQVTVAFALVGAGAPSVAAVEFVGPAGVPYERQEVALTRSAYEAHHLEFVLPVAATAIDTGKLSGTWIARLLIDGKPTRDHSFELTP